MPIASGWPITSNAGSREEEEEFPIPTRTFRRLALGGDDALFHFDDKLWPEKEDARREAGKVEMNVEAGALNVLLPGKR